MRFLTLLKDIWKFFTFRHEPRFDARNPAASILELTKNLSHDDKKIVANTICSLLLYETLTNSSRNEKRKPMWDPIDNLTLVEILKKGPKLLERNREIRRQKEADAEE